ncbi:MAG TPA: tetratricopeptide repeat protein, partial [Planctomycetota bacterium]|nr:tetratricopeptide repeat protein [Planctomycetota bacterium]
GDPPHLEALLERARALARDGEEKQAIAAVNEIIDALPKSVAAHRLRAEIRSSFGRHEEAAADWARVVELDPEDADAHDRHGDALLKSGRAEEAIAAFDRYLAHRPEFSPYHWRRGIALYWAGRYEDGGKQFERYQTVDANDVENGIWHFLCVARASGVEEARRRALPIGRDVRVPLPQVWELFLGKGSLDEVERAMDAGAPRPWELRSRLFYGHLYLGLYHDLEGRLDKAIEHLKRAVERDGLPGFMHDVARVHLSLVEKRRKELEKPKGEGEGSGEAKSGAAPDSEAKSAPSSPTR